MVKVRITKEFSFEAAHLLTGYDGLCANIHGHSYRLFVTLRGEPLRDEASPKDGMLMDFGVLKGIVHEEVISPLDHTLMIRVGAHPALCALSATLRVQEFPFQPTCENLLIWMAKRLVSRLPAGVELFSLRLHETATSFAEWFVEDNE